MQKLNMTVTGESFLGADGKEHFRLVFESSIKMHQWFSSQGYVMKGKYFVSPEGVRWRKRNKYAVRYV